LGAPEGQFGSSKPVLVEWNLAETKEPVGSGVAAIAERDSGGNGEGCRAIIAKVIALKNPGITVGSLYVYVSD